MSEETPPPEITPSDDELSDVGISDTERDERLRALLSVDIDRPLRATRGARRAARRGTDPDDPSTADPVSADPLPSGLVADADGAAPDAHDAPAHRGAKRRPPRRATTLARIVSATVLAVLLVGGLGLVYAGTEVIRNSTEGELFSPVTDPGAPGFEALVDATPTLALLHDDAGTIDSITVLTLPDPRGGGGGVLLVPTRIVADLPVFGVAPIEAAYDLGTPAQQADVVGDLLVAAIGEVAVVDDARWAGLVEPVAPITVDNPDPIEIDGELRFPNGEIDLAPEDVGPYLRARVEGESELARLFRHETFWRAWLQAVADAGGTDAVPGELQTGLGRFVRVLAAGDDEIETVPVSATVTEGFEEEPTFRPDRRPLADLVARFIPFPRSPRPGVRSRLRVLNGTPDTDEAARIAADLAPAGVEVVLVGNAASFDVELTTIAYLGAEHRAAAEAVRDLLGVGEVQEETRPSDAVDITVTLGADHG